MVREMMTSITFDVPIVKGKARHRNGRGHSYTPAPTREAEDAIRHEWCRVAYGAQAMPHVPVTVEIVTERRLPKSKAKGVESEPDTVRPDADNIAKLVLDALNGIAWADDSQVTHLEVRPQDRKRDTNERTVVTVSWEEQKR